MPKDNILEIGKNTRFTSGKKAEEMGRRGGKKHGENIKKRKNFIEAANMLLSLDCKIDKANQVMKTLGIKKEDQTNLVACLVALYQKALKGDVQAIVTLRDTAGQKPTNNIELTGKDGTALNPEPIVVKIVKADGNRDNPNIREVE